MPNFIKLRNKPWIYWSFQGRSYDPMDNMINADTIIDDNQTGW